MFGQGRKFSTLRKRLSFTKAGGEDDLGRAREARDLKSRIRSRSKYTKSVDTGSNSDAESDDRDSFSVDDMPRASSTVSNNVVFTEMPSPKEVDELLEKTLEELAIPEGGRAKFQAKSIEEKWKVVQAHLNYNPRRKGGSKDVKSAAYWIKKLLQVSSRGRPRITIKESLDMVSVFRTAHKDFITDFLEKNGVTVMNKVTMRISQRVTRDKLEAKVLLNLVECYRLLMNTEIGMKGVLIVPGSVDAIAMAMDLGGNDTVVTEKVMLLLSVMCWWDEQGRIKVMRAMRHIKKRFMEISTFQTIVYIFQHSDNISFKASVATFITTVCNTPPDIEQRVGVRNYFFRLDVISIFQKVLSKAPENAFEEEGPWQAINTQYQVFVAMMRQDQEEIVHKLVAATDADDSHFDLSNLQDSWKILQKNAFKADCQLELLNIVQALFLVPTVHDLAVPIFEAISKFIYEAASMDDLQLASHEKIDFAKQPVMNFEELGKLLKKKIEYNARMEVFSEKEGTVKRLRKLVGVMQKRLMDVTSGQIPPEEAMDLQEDLIKNHLLNPNKRQKQSKKRRVKKVGTLTRAQPALTLATSPGDINISFLAGLGLMDTAGEVEILKEREGKLKQEIDKLQKQVMVLSKGGKIDPSKTAGTKAVGAPQVGKPAVKLDSTGLEPAGIAPGKQLVAPPPVPKSGMPGSLENAPLEWNAKAVGGAPAKKKGPGGVKQGGLEGLFAARAGALKKPKNNKAEKYKKALEKLGLPDKKPMKPTCKMTQVFWKVIAPDALEGTIWPELSDQAVKYDAVALEEIFGKKDSDKKRNTKAPKAVSDEIKLIDGKRRQNLAIALKKIKIDFSNIKAAIVGVDLEVISKDNIQVFIETIPSVDELTLLNKFTKEGGDPSKLPFEEKYLFEVSQIPNLLNRLKCIQTFYRFAYEARRIHSVIMRMKKALKEVNNSAELRQILEIVLAIGNYMNGASARGAAWGFKLDILINLINVKYADNSGTLMHFLYALFEQNYPNLCEFSLPASAEVVDINFKEAVKEMNKLAKQIGALKQEIKKKPFSKADKLKKRFQAFEVKATRDTEKLQQLLEKVRADFHNLAALFAEKGPEIEPCTFFPKLVGFEQDMKRAGAQLVEMREAELRKKLQEEKKQERLAQRQLKLLVEKAKDENGEINIGLIEAYKRSQQGKANQVVDRFLEKYNRDRSRLRRNNKQRRSVTRKKKGRYLD